MYGVSPHPAQAPENSKRGSSNLDVFDVRMGKPVAIKIRYRKKSQFFALSFVSEVLAAAY